MGNIPEMKEQNKAGTKIVYKKEGIYRQIWKRNTKTGL